MIDDDEPPSLHDNETGILCKQVAGEIFRTGGMHGVELAEALIRDARARNRAARSRGLRLRAAPAED